MLIKKIKKNFMILLFVIGSMAIVFFVNGAIEYIAVRGIVNDFKSRGQLVYEDDTYSYYQVIPVYDYELSDSRKVFNYNDSYKYIGSKGDILLTNRNPMRHVPIVNIIVGFMSKYFYVGHSTLNVNEEGSMVIESVGNQATKNGVDYYINDWFYSSSQTPEIIGLRVKGINENDLDKVVEYAEDKLGYPYNFTFLFNRENSFYCTDLVSRSYKSANININYDHLATTGNDLIVSDQTYMIFYRELKWVNRRPHYNVYYLSKGD